MADGKLEIQGIEEVIKQVNQLKTEMAELVESMAKGVKATASYNEANLKNAKTLTEVNKAAAIEAKTQEQSNLARIKAEKATTALLIEEERLAKAKIASEAAAKRLETQTNKIAAAKKKGTESTNTWSKALDSFQFKFNALGNFMATGFLEAIGGVIGAIKMVIGWNDEYTRSLNSLGAITGLRGKDLNDLGKSAREMGFALNMSASEVLVAYEKVGSLLPVLLKNKEALKSVTEQAILLSKASGGKLGLEESTKAVGAVMNQFALKSDEASRVVNVLAAAEVEGSATTLDLTESLKNVGAVANGSNMTFEETSALLEILASKQIVGAEAGTKLRGAILKLQDAGIGYKTGIFNMGDALDELKAKLDKKTSAQEKDTEILKIFGIENATAGRILLENIQNYEDLTTKITGTNTALEQATIQTDSAATEWKKITLLFEDFATSGTFEKFNKGLAEGVRATITILGGLGGTIWETVRLIGEGLYRILDVGALVSGDYLKNLDKLYSGFQERIQGDIQNILHPLKEQALQAAKQTGDAVVMTYKETTNGMTAEEKERQEKLKKIREQYAKETLKLNEEMTEKERELQKNNADFEREFQKELAEMQLEEDQAMYDAQLQLIDEQYNAEIDRLNNQYAAKLEASAGNQLLIDEATTAHNESMLASELAYWLSVDAIQTSGNAKRIDSEGKVNDLLLQKAIKNAQDRAEAEQWLADARTKIRENEYTAAAGIGELFGTLAKKGSALEKAALIFSKGVAIAKIWTDVAAANAIITASANAAASTKLLIPGAGPILAAADIAAGASLIATNNINAGIQTGIIAAQTIGQLGFEGFKKGTNDAPGGPAIVGENPSGIPGKGREIITFPDGTQFLTPDHATFMPELPKHSKVTPNHLINEELKETLRLPDIVMNTKDEEIVKLLTKISKKKDVIYIDGVRHAARRSLEINSHLNNYYRC